MSNSPVLAMWTAVLCVAAAGLIIVTVLVMRRGSVVGPDRIPRGEPAGLLRWLTISALALWIFIPGFYVGSIESSGGVPATVPGTQPHRPSFSATQTIVLSLASSVTVSGVLIAGNLLLRPGGLTMLGLGGLWRGIRLGLLGSLLIVPLSILAGIGTEQLWQLIDYDHPGVHEVLRILEGTESGLMRLLIYASAVVVAPFFEELLFRGHVQTLLGRFLRGLIVPQPHVAAGAPGEPVLSYESAADRSQRDEAAARWLAIFITSALFALVHEALWMMPPIFFLSICLGYIYERTGSLWAAIVGHTMFNLVNVLIFVALAAR